MKFSIIIPYRNREAHLKTLLPALVIKFKNENYEIIVSEQDNNESFRIAAVENIGYQHATGDIIVLHQVDYIPHADVSYDVNLVPILPARRGIFVNEDMSLRPIEDIPAGYRNWNIDITPDFHGGVICLKREHFEKIGGLNPLIKNWGHEDTDLGYRLQWAGIPANRNEVGTFTCLYHKDNNPELKQDDKQGLADFYDARTILQEAYQYKDIGYKNLIATVDKFEFPLTGTDKTGIWLKSRNYKVNI